MSTCHIMSQETSEEALYTEIDRKNGEPRLSPEHGRTLAVETHLHMPQETSEDALVEHFARTCAVETHVHMSQETSEEALNTEILQEKCRGPD